tara:strand:- start:379 stop:1077 length:699 start_codon:yes stop_codon:yes gene_type:complete
MFNNNILPTVKISSLSHSFGLGENRRKVLQSVSFEIQPGEVVLLTGPSGCGKTTLLTLIGALRKVEQGNISVFGYDLKNSSRHIRQNIRRNIGMIFQGHNLIRCLTAEQNVQMGADLINNVPYLLRRRQARDWLKVVGLEDHMDKQPHDLSGGQKQRVAIARALAAKPKLLLADEPTAALDSVTGREIVDLLKRLAREQSSSVLMVTHDPRILDVADRLLEMEDGKLFTTIG